MTSLTSTPKINYLIYVFAFILAFLISLGLYPHALRLFAYDANQYCDYQGVYYENTDDFYDAHKADGVSFKRSEYALICNINELNFQKISEFPEVKSYHVTRGNVREIQPEIKLAYGLEELQIQDQEVDILPDEISQLPHLRVLKLGGNRLRELNPGLFELKTLEGLYLYRNQIEMLPGQIDNLENLRVLDLRYNQLKRLPMSIGRLANTLETLYLGGNEFSSLEREYIRELLPNTSVFF